MSWFTWHRWERTLEVYPKPGNTVQKVIDRLSAGEGNRVLVRRRKWPWQHPDTHEIGIALIQPGEYCESLVVRNYVHLKGVTRGPLHFGWFTDAINHRLRLWRWTNPCRITMPDGADKILLLEGKTSLRNLTLVGPWDF